MAVDEIHQYDIGTVLRVTVKDGTAVVDISAATAKFLNLYKPSGGSVAKTASFTNSGTDGQMQYITVANDLNEVGTWRLQAYLELASWKGHSDIVQFEVYPNG